MSTDAVVLVQIPSKALGALGEGFTVRPLDDGSLIVTSMSMREAEPADIAAEVGASLGALLATHDDSRGLFIFPAAAMPKCKNYYAVIEEVGEMGEWVPLAEADPGIDMMDLQRELLGNPAAMQAAMSQVSQVLADPEKARAIADAMKQLTGGADLSGMLEQLGKMDPAELQRQAQAMFGGAGGLPGMDDTTDDDEDDEPPGR